MTTLQADVDAVKELVNEGKRLSPIYTNEFGSLHGSDAEWAVKVAKCLPSIERLLGIVSGVQEAVAKPDYTNPFAYERLILSLMALLHREK